MVNLILVIIAIGLTAGLLAATINYLPTSRAQTDTTYIVAKDGFVTLENAFKAYSKANGGSAPVPNSGVADGGISVFQPYYAFLPKAPDGSAWRYGQIAGTSPQEYYFCLYSTNSDGLEKGVVLGLHRLRTVFSDQQYFMAGYASDPAENCGTKSSTWSSPSSFPAKISYTYAVRYVDQMP